MERAGASSMISPRIVVMGALLSALEGSSGINLYRGYRTILQSRREGVNPAMRLISPGPGDESLLK